MTENPKVMRRLRLAAIFALVGVVLIMWSIFDPTPVPIIVSMSVGQVIGTLSFMLYLAVVLPELQRTLRRGHRRAKKSAAAADDEPAADDDEPAADDDDEPATDDGDDEPATDDGDDEPATDDDEPADAKPADARSQPAGKPGSQDS